jgi:integrase
MRFSGSAVRATKQKTATPSSPPAQARHLTTPASTTASSNPPHDARECPGLQFHTLRHTCATLLFRNGLNAKQVQMWLGHHSPAFTLAVYVHLLTDDLPDADFLDALTQRRETTRALPSASKPASVY